MPHTCTLIQVLMAFDVAVKTIEPNSLHIWAHAKVYSKQFYGVRWFTLIPLLSKFWTLYTVCKWAVNAYTFVKFL